MKIIIIEDEPAIADTLIHVLEMDGFEVFWFATATEGLSYLQNQSADLLVLDVGLPDGNGFELCKTIREFSEIAIIFLTARNDEIDRVVGLEIGADDYVTKPFSPREMLARIKLRIKKSIHSVNSAKSKEQAVTSQLKAENFDYLYNGERLGLTAVEFKILAKLIDSNGQVLSREQLMVAADMAPQAAYERNIDSHIKAIRSKLKDKGCGDWLKTKRSFGYYFSQS